MGRRWTPEEDEYLREWYGRTGMSIWHMAKDLCRTEGATYQRIRTLGLYPPEKPAVGGHKRRAPRKNAPNAAYIHATEILP